VGTIVSCAQSHYEELTDRLFFVTDGMLEIVLERSIVMPMKRFGAEQIVTLLRRIEVTMDQGKSTWLACRGAGISEQKFYRWRQKYGGLDLDQPRGMKDLEKEKVRLE